MINQTLKAYLENNILPKYQSLDLAHSGRHVYDVIEKSLEIAKDYEVDLNMVYTVAAFHDLGLIVERDRHHIIGAQMLYDDEFLKSVFSLEQLTIMKDAVEDHRASAKEMPRSIYGSIVAEADRSDDMDTVILRTILFRAKSDESFETIYPDIYEHIQEKYGVHGYLKVFLDTKHTKKMLSDIRKLLKDKDAFKAYVQKIYENMK